MSQSKLEQEFLFQVRVLGLPAPEAEYRFCKRRWRFDFAWPDKMLAVELEGGTWTFGRHTRGSGYDKDIEKYNEATRLGWRIVRGTTKHLKDGSLIFTVQELLK